MRTMSPLTLEISSVGTIMESLGSFETEACAALIVLWHQRKMLSEWTPVTGRDLGVLLASDPIAMEWVGNSIWHKVSPSRMVKEGWVTGWSNSDDPIVVTDKFKAAMEQAFQKAEKRRLETPMTYTKEELQQIVSMMKRASNLFYGMAVAIENHPFIEFTGFMNEYIKMCERALSEGKDFTQASAHSGLPLIDMQDYEAKYLGEKFGCIFATSFNGNMELISKFCGEAFGIDIKTGQPLKQDEEPHGV